MPFVTPDYTDIRTAILRDIANLLPEASVAADSDFAVRAGAVAAAVEGIYQMQQWVSRQILPDTADADYLERWASLYGLTRIPAASAAGTIDFTGVNGSSIPSGSESKTAAGVTFITTAPAVIAGGVANVAASAAAAGVAGNQAAATALTLTAAPAGVNSTAAIATMTGGADSETDAALLARLLRRIQQPPHGGAAHDYVAWAGEVAGVAGAYVYPLRRGAGTVDVIITASGGLPGSPLIDAVQTYINNLRPVTANCLVLGPTAVAVAVTAALTLGSGTTLAAATSAINAALTAYFATLTPGDTAYLNRIRALIADTAGVVDFTLAAPTANVTTTVDATHSEMATLGTVTLT